MWTWRAVQQFRVRGSSLEGHYGQRRGNDEPPPSFVTQVVPSGGSEQTDWATGGGTLVVGRGQSTDRRACGCRGWVCEKSCTVRVRGTSAWGKRTVRGGAHLRRGACETRLGRWVRRWHGLAVSAVGAGTGNRQDTHGRVGIARRVRAPQNSRTPRRRGAAGGMPHTAHTVPSDTSARISFCRSAPGGRGWPRPGRGRKAPQRSNCSARARGDALVGLLRLDADLLWWEHSPPQAAAAGAGGGEQPHAHKAACVGSEPKAHIARQLEAE